MSREYDKYKDTLAGDSNVIVVTPPGLTRFWELDRAGKVPRNRHYTQENCMGQDEHRSSSWVSFMHANGQGSNNKDDPTTAFFLRLADRAAKETTLRLLPPAEIICVDPWAPDPPPRCPSCGGPAPQIIERVVYRDRPSIFRRIFGGRL